MTFHRWAIGFGCFVLGVATSLTIVYGAEALGTKEAREKIALMDGLADLPKDSVKIKSINSGPGGNAVVEAQIDTAFKFTRTKSGWQVTDIRLGAGQWESLEVMKAAFNNEKAARTRADLSNLKAAIESFKKERGRLFPAKNIVELTDALAPRYMPSVIRLDAWGHELVYTTTAQGYRLSSAGPDGKTGTADDIVLES
jgi:hypothetical protein